MDDHYSVDDMVDVQHSLLLKNSAASYGRKFQRIKPPNRNDASLELTEFHLLHKRSKGLVNDLTTSLDITGKHAQASQKVTKVKKLIKCLPVPLEKPEAEKIKRTVAYDASKSLLNRWEPIIGANRVADQLNFPLNVPYFRGTSSKNFLKNSRSKTPLEKEVESILMGVSGEKKEDDHQKKTFFLNRKEIMQQRRELAHIRAQQSFKEAKAWRQNKIKSKKYHRVLRRERTKKQIKEFEELQKTDPEAALKKLEELEKTRVEERVTLRHRSTGQWARNKTVHASYDKQCREVLAEQLRLGRELTQKVRVIDGSDEEDEAEENRVLPNRENNPWMQKDSNEYSEFSSSYQKFWNQQQAEKNEPNKPENSTDVESSIRDSSSNLGNVPESDEKMAKIIVRKRNKLSGHSVTKFGFFVNNTEMEDTKKSLLNASVNSNWECTTLKKSVKGSEKQKKESCEKIMSCNEVDLDDIFEGMEVKLKNKVQKKLNSFKLVVKQTQKSTKKKTSKPVKVTEDKNSVQNLRGKKLHFDVSAKMSETFANFDKDIKATDSILSRISASPSASKALPESQKKSSDLTIDPKRFMSIDESKLLKSAIPNMSEAGDENREEAAKNNSLTIAEAFKEDDIANKFRHEKEAVVEEHKVKGVDLTLPGWGEWTGNGLLDLPKRRKKCFVINAPKSIPRKDDRKDSIIINENADAKARVHQVSELPFPYSGVNSFEASIRAPLGSTWIPETAHKKLTERKVSTLMGAVIEPLTEDAIIDKCEMEDFGEHQEFAPEEL